MEVFSGGTSEAPVGKFDHFAKWGILSLTECTFKRYFFMAFARHFLVTSAKSVGFSLFSEKR